LCLRAPLLKTRRHQLINLTGIVLDAARVGGQLPSNVRISERRPTRSGVGTMAMKNSRDVFAQTDQQVSVLKERIARQREAIKQAKLRGYSTAAAETIQHTLHQSLRAFEKRRQQVFERIEATRARADKPDVP
jgi:predicted RNA-binding protein